MNTRSSSPKTAAATTTTMTTGREILARRREGGDATKRSRPKAIQLDTFQYSPVAMAATTTTATTIINNKFNESPISKRNARPAASYGDKEHANDHYHYDGVNDVGNKCAQMAANTQQFNQINLHTTTTATTTTRTDATTPQYKNQAIAAVAGVQTPDAPNEVISVLFVTTATTTTTTTTATTPDQQQQVVATSLLQSKSTVALPAFVRTAPMSRTLPLRRTRSAPALKIPNLATCSDQLQHPHNSNNNYKNTITGGSECFRPSNCSPDIQPTLINESAAIATVAVSAASGTSSDTAVDEYGGSVTGIGVTIADKQRFGCAHYKRRAMFVTPCCDKFYNCRFCHDENENHHFDRKTLTELICSECGTRQRVQERCENCAVRFGKYTCLSCNLFDDSDKQQYHCDACGICRVGGTENFFHCKVCDMCLPIQLKIDGHRCVENVSRSHCPVCLGDIHTSRIPCHIPDCGHLLHKMCFDQLLASGHYTCPTCQTSLMDMTALWEYLDERALLMPIPHKYENQRIHIFCNDCHKTSKTKFHFIGLKCLQCGAYNTTQDVKRRLSLVADEPSTA